MRKDSVAINKSLYLIREQKGESLKDAATAMHISKLRLKLVEEGYLPVTKKLKTKLIKHYKLKKDYFSTHSTYVEPLNNIEDSDATVMKIRRGIGSLKVRIISGVIALASVGVLAYGIYSSNVYYLNPTATWSEKYTKFDKNFKELEDCKEHFDPFMMDKCFRLISTFENPTETIKGTLKYTTDVYEKAENACSTNLIVEYTSAAEEKLTFTIAVYNRHIFYLVDYTPTDKEFIITTAVCFYDSDGESKLRPFTYVDKNGEVIKADEGSPIFNYLKSIVDESFSTFLNFYNDNVLQPIVNDPTYRPYELFHDVQIISRNFVYHLRLGYYLTLASGIVLALSASLLVLSFIIRPKKILNAKKKEKASVNFSLSIVSLPARDLPSDIGFTPFVPEFVLKIVGLVIILLFGIGLNLATYWQLNVSIFTPDNLKDLRDTTNNLLIAGITLLFFVKIDVYYKKTQRDLLTNIFALFVGGLVFYLLEIITFSTIFKMQNLLQVILQVLQPIIPGNIFWNLMLYSLIFYFLFTTPKRYHNQSHKILRFRLLSLIPTFFLIFAFIYKYAIEPMLSAPYYISFIFFTKGIIMTLFAIIYMYSLYFMQLYYKLRFGEKTAELYFSSRRFSLSKNLVACIILILLYVVDVSIGHTIPDNILNLGTNWSILILVPFIFFYRPHLGKRNLKWDNAYIVLYAVIFGGSYLLAVMQIANIFDFSQLVEIIS